MELRIFSEIALKMGKFLVLDKSQDVEDSGCYLILLRKDNKNRWRVYRDIDTPSPDGLALMQEKSSELQHDWTALLPHAGHADLVFSSE